MEARELRIGNLIKVYGSQVVVYYIDEAGINGVVNPHDGLDIIYPKLIEPIPITEEWLLKFGFSRYGTREGIYRVYSGCKYIHVGFHPRYMDLLHVYLSDLETIIMTVKSVHELQNIIYCLTREELTIKEIAK
jgi:hypothetical protein